MLRHLLNVALRLRRLYWWLVRPVTRGVRGLVVNANGEVLLVRHRYGQRHWLLPGGRVGRRESDLDALHRELREEVSVTGIERPALLGEYVSSAEFKRDTITVWQVSHFVGDNVAAHFEIDSTRFFSPSDLPPDVSPATRRRIEEWAGQRPINKQW